MSSNGLMAPKTYVARNARAGSRNPAKSPWNASVVAAA